MSYDQELIQVEPLLLKFPFELRKQLSSSFEVLNKTNEYVSFKVKVTKLKIYCVRPNCGILSPGSKSQIVVTMQAQREIPPGMQCKDKFQVVSTFAKATTTMNDITHDMFKEEPGKVVHGIVMRVAYEFDPLMPVPEGSEQVSSSSTSIYSSTDLNETEYDTEDAHPPSVDVHPKSQDLDENANLNQHEDSEQQSNASVDLAAIGSLSDAEAKRRMEIEEELAKVKKESEDSKNLLEEFLRTLSHAYSLRESIEKKYAQFKLGQRNCMEFTYSKLEEATNNFDESCKIGEGGFSTVYKGFLGDTPVAIKKLKFKDEREFNEEVETLSKVRHPNLVTLIGACNDNESPAIVYEYLPNGSLEDHLNKTKKTPPLSGQTRIRIALEICSVLSFLHSIPRAHGDLKPDNILLDSNYVSKLGDFGTSRELEMSQHTVTPFHQTENVKGTYAYMDPDHISSGRITPNADVFSFGVVLLRLATGKGTTEIVEGITMSIRELVEMAIARKKFDTLVDVEWPTKDAPEKMAKLGLRCFEPRWREPGRPDAATLFMSLMDIAYNK